MASNLRDTLYILSLKMTVFWVVSCSLVEVYRRFRSACCLHYESDRHRENLKSHMYYPSSAFTDLALFLLPIQK
jgi:hypothetical protein